MEDKLLQIIEHYGVSHQQRKLAEEVFELQEVITRYLEGAFNNFDSGLSRQEYIKDIAEELADVMVMLTQFKEYYHIDGKEIMKIMNEKIDRQLKRIEDGD